VLLDKNASRVEFSKVLEQYRNTVDLQPVQASQQNTQAVFDQTVQQALPADLAGLPINQELLARIMQQASGDASQEKALIPELIKLRDAQPQTAADAYQQLLASQTSASGQFMEPQHAAFAKLAQQVSEFFGVADTQAAKDSAQLNTQAATLHALAVVKDSNANGDAFALVSLANGKLVQVDKTNIAAVALPNAQESSKASASVLELPTSAIEMLNVLQSAKTQVVEASPSQAQPLAQQEVIAPLMKPAASKEQVATNYQDARSKLNELTAHMQKADQQAQVIADKTTADRALNHTKLSTDQADQQAQVIADKTTADRALNHTKLSTDQADQLVANKVIAADMHREAGKQDKHLADQAKENLANAVGDNKAENKKLAQANFETSRQELAAFQKTLVAKQEVSADMLSKAINTTTSQGSMAEQVVSGGINQQTQTQVKFTDAPFMRFMHAQSAESPTEQIKVQLKSAVADGSSKIEIQLQPAELGRVEVTMNIQADGKTAVIISADSKDTLDMLQRDVKALERALNESGLKADSGNLSFNLKGDGQQQPDQEQNFASHNNLHANEDKQEQGSVNSAYIAQYNLSATNGVDIRV
jgi:flagellar hook-length control protein FliK